MQVYVAESASADDFFQRRWEGHVVEEIARLLGGRAFYRIVISRDLLAEAIHRAKKSDCEVFHLSCHGLVDSDDTALGVALTSGETLSWDELAGCFEDAGYAPEALVLSSCLGGDRGAARAFKAQAQRPRVIFGSEGERKNSLTFAGACVSWPILYTELETQGMAREVFRDAIDKMNSVAAHKFVYWRWDDDRDGYRRYPAR